MSSHTVADLRKMATARKILGRSKAKTKAALIKLLQDHGVLPAPAAAAAAQSPRRSPKKKVQKVKSKKAKKARQLKPVMVEWIYVPEDSGATSYKMKGGRIIRSDMYYIMAGMLFTVYGDVVHDEAPILELVQAAIRDGQYSSLVILHVDWDKLSVKDQQTLLRKAQVAKLKIRVGPLKPLPGTLPYV